MEKEYITRIRKIIIYNLKNDNNDDYYGDEVGYQELPEIKCESDYHQGDG